MDITPKHKPYVKIGIPGELLKIDTTDSTLELPLSRILITWEALDRPPVDIRELTDSHLNNLHPFLMQSGCGIAANIIYCEILRRADGEYPSVFEERVQQYKSHPETFRMVVHG